MTTRTTAFAALLTLATAAVAEEPAQLISIDPLTLPAPTMLEPMRFEPDSRTPAEKIQPALWESALKSDPNEEIQVIVTLHEPVLASDLRGPSEQADSYRVQWVSSLAHEFEFQARALSTGAIRALSHFPILFVSIRTGDLAAVAALPHVRSVEATPLYYATRAQAGGLMNATTLRNSFGGTGSGIGVAVIDSGVDATNGELASRVIVQGDFTGTTGDGRIDGTGHGTAVAGIIAGSLGGMAPQAGIWALKVFKNDGTPGPGDVVLAALNSAYANRANFGGLDVINMSLGQHGEFNSDCDAAFVAQSSIVNQLVSAGISIFAASGNDEHLAGISSPACLANVISVGAVSDAPGVTDVGCTFTGPTVNYPQADQILCYSNSGNPLDILAPSACATTPNSGLHGGGLWSCFNGTSAASPYAAGVAAQILSLRPSTTPAQLKAALMTTGRAITDANGVTRNRIDAVQAYQALAGSGGGPCVPGATTLCLYGNRFEVKATYTDYSDNTGPAQAQVLTPDSGYFWFFSPTNVEAVGKIVSFCNGGSNGNFGFYAGGLTDVGVVMTVRDTVANQTLTFTNARGHRFDMIADSFNTCP